MAHFKRKQPKHRTFSRRSRRHGFSLNSWPAYWDVLWHRRKPRRALRRAEKLALTGADPDNLLWPLAKKPHHYYW